ncbi:MAG: hypothetical protein K5978_05435 [Campylobacter sp.]|nr:hypothetical protein [Campylobacter sp.]
MNKILTHITIEATSALKIGSGNSDLFIDSPILRDFNGLPMILGTSLSGALRAAIDKSKADKIFGSMDTGGSALIVSNALLLDENNKVHEKLITQKSNFLKLFDTLPLREHTAINEFGANVNGSKFDEEVLFKGTRFKFALEIPSEFKTEFDEILKVLASPVFRLGGGASKGFGAFKIISIKSAELNLQEYSSSLNFEFKGETKEIKSDHLSDFDKYELKLSPDDFFMFGSGLGDGDADATPVFESFIDYEKAKLSQKHILIPATSIKGAVSHRSAFYYNLQNSDNKVGEENPAVRDIFGYKKDKDISGAKGKIMISDCYKSFDDTKTKVFDHVAINRFTGGAIEGALFQEKVVQTDEFCIEIFLKQNIDEKSQKAFESTLLDITQSRLPLGGMTTKGHGFFSGKVYKNGEELK